MGGTDLEVEQTEGERVYAWRLRELRRAGYDELEAELIAVDDTIDLHAAVDLLERGCERTVAVKILL